jgi:hypothetical protein
MDKNTKITIAISALVIAIFFLAMSFGGKSKEKTTDELSLNATTTKEEIIIDSKEAFTPVTKKASEIVMNKIEGLSVKDQLADEYVSFSGVNFEDDTWVAVYEDKNGEPSNLIGTGLFFGGITEGMSPVVRPTVKGLKYYVTLIKDNGDRVFNMAEDKPSKDSPIVSFIAK